jgi:hypothetical protein
LPLWIIAPPPSRENKENNISKLFFQKNILQFIFYKPPRFALRLLEKLVKKISGTFAGMITDNFTVKLRR